ncbi:hypothetical protein [Xanthomonas campestris]|uniref:hypothetical protein n=1 Tax=Xanthomonas campestris TaxID=339 RepID=UPI00021AF073|nr:hypothetical protein [Xanthomonas campestris]MEB2258863.1 hypothetical protein [Xanthomonas campestris pv. campestris]AEL04990.1 conserved hypothetical protein [Xanthomonas campestris pv. raphani 756C]MEA9673796.1 hypothetical protein [Xanthomonas campestris pv. raphani]MEA9770969.1 hypothetical protein [Xanthomonas campestris pv. raphani]MEA9775537.1 hypothetical protein [Xanthomonas campestris pv. raphani]
MSYTTRLLPRAGMHVIQRVALTAMLPLCLSVMPAAQAARNTATAAAAAPEVARTATVRADTARTAAQAANTPRPTAPTSAPTRPATSGVTTHGQLRLSASADQDAYVLIHNGENVMHGTLDDLRRAQRLAGNSNAVLWFRTGGKSYVVRDPATLDRLHALYAPVARLGDAQGALGERQGRLGEQQGALGEQIAALAAHDAAAAAAQAHAAIAGDPSASNKAEHAAQQANAAQQRSKQQQMEALATQQAALAAQQAGLAEQQAVASARAEAQARSLMREAIQHGLATLVER